MKHYVSWLIQIDSTRSTGAKLGEFLLNPGGMNSGHFLSLRLSSLTKFLLRVTLVLKLEEFKATYLHPSRNGLIGLDPLRQTKGLMDGPKHVSDF